MVGNTNIRILFNFTIFFVIIMLILEIIFSIIKKSKNMEKKIPIFGIFMGLSNLSIVAISALIIRYLFVLWSLFDNNQVSIVHLIVILSLTLIFGFILRKVKVLLLEVFSSFLLYFAIICLRILSGYLIDVRFEWYILLGKICLITFIIIYATFSLLKNINEVSLKNKYIRRIRNENS